MNRTYTAASGSARSRAHLLKLKDLVDGRGDVVYRLARVEALLGNRVAAMENLSTRLVGPSTGGPGK